jgi:hypothetical protein
MNQYLKNAETVLFNDENWKIFLEELDDFISIIYTRKSWGCYEMNCNFLGNKTTGSISSRSNVSQSFSRFNEKSKAF